MAIGESSSSQPGLAYEIYLATFSLITHESNFATLILKSDQAHALSSFQFYFTSPQR